MSQKISSRNLETNFQTSSIKPLKHTLSHYYIRLSVKNKPGVLEQISLQFSEKSISIEKIIQKESNSDSAEIVIITNNIPHQHYLEVKEALTNLSVSNAIESSIRLYKNL